ncbi:hypothetical protein P153DRAFT_370173 [Dothidotthia symphoricarpi CBS 119687]|uniref:Secreted protein n=1 Tax=Dothidotthia symphoricarpi CBS 119687 TaxID=1392245 RepID=A0A6A6A2Y9_9PLEO|nr:uncharacterized protein P153DRAFT_370173 [Dothidotthia symphoricarpi CBS 119687]KAF2125514.1 hypothetical protein P153DRAFT_370173 [Dothidotthia symphoricarpi CBS 119687]
MTVVNAPIASWLFPTCLSSALGSQGGQWAREAGSRLQLPGRVIFTPFHVPPSQPCEGVDQQNPDSECTWTRYMISNRCL